MFSLSALLLAILCTHCTTGTLLDPRRSCYRVGMNLRSSVVTSIYHKALSISVASLSRKTLGEITNLMSVDSSRLQVRLGLFPLLFLPA